MARLTRQVGIRAAEVRLPGPSRAGPALLKTAAGIADIAFEKQADKLTQEARIAAAALDFERDGDGNLTAPSLPLSEEGLLTPSIYDRAYTQMVATRYANQAKIDTSERLNLIATENRFDPEKYKELAEDYVAKVTELAPDMLKPDVNQAAQVTMVEHYNRIIRQTAERDHAEARQVQLLSIDKLNDNLIGYVEAGASDDIIGAQWLQIRAKIAEGRDVREGGFGFWDDATEAEMLDGVEKRYALAKIVAGISRISDDPLAHAEALKALNDFALGDGTVELLDELGEVYKADVTDVWPNPEDRDLIASHASAVLNTKQIAFQNLRDERLKRDYNEFFNWFSPHALNNRPQGLPLDMDRLYDEYDKAHNNVVNRRYDDTLRETIRGIIEGELRNAGGGSMSQWQKDFEPGWQNWLERYQAEVVRMTDGEPLDSFSEEDRRKIDAAAVNRVGNIPGGNKQSADGEREIHRYYNGMTGREMTQSYYENLITDPNAEGWQELQYLVPNRMARIGIWPKELNDAIIGKLMAPEGMQAGTLDNTLKLARMFWDNPSFRSNMQDANALGHQVGGALEYLFHNNGVLTADNVRKVIEDFGNSDYDPYINWSKMEREDREEWADKAKSYMEKQFTNNWWIFGGPEGKEVPRWAEGGFNPLSPQLTGLDNIYQDKVIDKMKAYAGRMDPDNPDAFAPYLHKAVNEVMNENGLAPTKIGYSATRYSRYYEGQLWPPTAWVRGFMRPAWAVVTRPPEYFVAADREITDAGGLPAGKINTEFMEKYVEKDFQTVLDYFSKQEWPNDESHYKAGVNAGLKYSGIDSSPDRNNQPVWHIVLIGDDGISERILTERGRFEDNPVLFHYDDAKKRYLSDKQKERIRQSELSALQREFEKNNALRAL